MLGPDHTFIGWVQVALGRTYLDTLRFEEARPFFERALAIQEGAFGPAHPEVAGSYNNLAWVDERLADYESARTLYDLALEIAEELHGTDHPTYAMFLQNTGSVSHKLGDLDAAVCVELTKRFEDVVTGRLSELVAAFPEPPRGEVTVVIDANPPAEPAGPPGLPPLP